jgi:YHS domain-containing protein
MMTKTTTWLRRSGVATLLAAATALGGCSAMFAQNPGGALKPVNAVPSDSGPLMLHGHDVVAYFALGRHLPGNPALASVYEGVTFRFASADHKRLFDAAPAKYLPQYGGYCANGIAYGIPWGGDADTWQMIDGKLYIFGGQASKDGFMVDVAKYRALADKYWAEEVAGSNSWMQRYKRLVFRVPHYKSGDEVAREVAAAKARKG